jgi:octaprenyl-diphosphate synthase
MSILETIKAPIEEEIKIFNQKLNDFYKESDIELLQEVANHVLNTKGKQIRPIISLLVAKLFGKKISKDVYNNAIFVETLHLSSLIHDDIVDKADYRRSKKTINNIWGNSIAVLFGDYLFSKALKKSMENKTTDLLDLGTQVIINMAKGEFLQKEKSESLDTTIDDYMNIIEWKTGSLLETCAVSSAISCEADVAQCNNMKDFGRYLGIMFQMKDDLLDYSDSKETGKKTNIDITDRKLTIPVLLAFEEAPQERERIVEIFKSDDIENHIDSVVNFVKSNNGIEKTYALLKEYKEKATLIIDSFEDSEAKIALKALVDFFVNRNL